MEKHHLMLGVNGLEYIVDIYVKCNKITRIDDEKLLLDNIEIDFGSYIAIEGENEDEQNGL